MRSRGSDEAVARLAVGARGGGAPGVPSGCRADRALSCRQPGRARHLSRADRNQHHRLARRVAQRVGGVDFDIFRELIEINTTDSLGNTPRAARAVARRLLAAGFATPDVRVLIGPDAKHGNLVARYRGTGGGGRPILVFAHLDVVPARRADWSVDPFPFLEKAG